MDDLQDLQRKLADTKLTLSSLKRELVSLNNYDQDTTTRSIKCEECNKLFDSNYEFICEFCTCLLMEKYDRIFMAHKSLVFRQRMKLGRTNS